VKPWIDVSLPLRHGLVPWPGDPPMRIERFSDIAQGDECTCSSLSLSAHTGTHIDAPLHFLRRGRPVDAIPIEAVVGPARVVAIRDPQVIHADELSGFRIRPGERLLFKTRNSTRRRRTPGFFEDYVAVSPEAARYLVRMRVRTVGIDGPSIGPYNHDLVATHRVLLGAGIWVIEGLDLRRAPAGACDFVCLPLRLEGADGAPARAVLRPRARRRGRA
jgi:arylformamidase